MKESFILKTILDGLAAKRIFAGRLNTGGGKVPGGYFHAHGFGKGAADILAFPVLRYICLRKSYPHPGAPALECGALSQFPMPLWIEVKSDRGRQSAEQKSFEIHVRSQGHEYLLVKSWEEVENWLKEHGL